MSFIGSLKHRLKPFYVLLLVFSLSGKLHLAYAQTAEEIKVFFLLSEAHRTLSDLGVVTVFGQATSSTADSSKQLALTVMKRYYSEKLLKISSERKTDSIGNLILDDSIFTRVQESTRKFLEKNGEPFLSHTIYDADSLYFRTYLVYWAPFEAIKAFAITDLRSDSLVNQSFLSVFENGEFNFHQYCKKELSKKYAKAYRKLNQQETLESYVDFKFIISALQIERHKDEERSADEKKLIRNTIYNFALSATRLIDSGIKEKRAKVQGKGTPITKEMKLWIANEGAAPLRNFAERENKKQLWRLLALLYAKGESTELAKEALKREKTALPE
ncbi:MAG: hypothetical protein SFU91_00815 [Chloroherpetonaceae bacterium]|nr:hypothetical protein [Chloroherpetonaceae bacterium]